MVLMPGPLRERERFLVERCHGASSWQQQAPGLGRHDRGGALGADSGLEVAQPRSDGGIGSLVVGVAEIAAEHEQ
jgi:hypothetical protein